MSEFTGERVIPGLVDPDLFNEHLARYKFAAHLLPSNAAVLDLGCGTGYGTAELTSATSVTAADISAEAIEHARAIYTRPGVQFIEASCTALPLEDHQFDLITAFEVIEHLEDWRGLLREAKRLLKPRGLFTVSTPNKSYYAETRGKTGPNPFHCHEFELAEFQTALSEFFPQVRIWTQNHTGAIVFAPAQPAAAIIQAEGSSEPEAAHFFVAVCGDSEVPNDLVAWVPQSGNVLRERERHIAKLEGEVGRKDAWLSRSIADHGSLQQTHERTLEELRAKNHWAETLNSQIADHRLLFRQLQDKVLEQAAWIADSEAQVGRLTELAGALTGRIGDMEAELEARTAWALRLDEQRADSEAQGAVLANELAEKIAHVRLLLSENAELTATIDGLLFTAGDLNATIDSLKATIDRLKAERRLAAQSKWLRLGTALHLGPILFDQEKTEAE